jgi:hypothetical protein
LPWLPRFVFLATLLGAGGGTLVLAILIGHRASPAGILVGAGSFAVLAGWCAFLCGNFYGVFRHGFRDALQHQDDLHDATRR